MLIAAEILKHGFSFQWDGSKKEGCNLVVFGANSFDFEKGSVYHTILSVIKLKPGEVTLGGQQHEVTAGEAKAYAYAAITSVRGAGLRGSQSKKVVAGHG